MAVTLINKNRVVRITNQNNQTVIQAKIRRVMIVTGRQGPAGVPGTLWFEGSGPPLDTLGKNGDMYHDIVDGMVYRKAAGTWGDPVGTLLPPGGTTGQVPTKASGDDFDIVWSDPTGGVESVTGLDTDNTDPANPVVKIAVDGSTITGEGTPDDPLVANVSPSGVQTVSAGAGISVTGTATDPVINSTITQYTDSDAIAALGPTLANYLLSSTAASTYFTISNFNSFFNTLGSAAFTSSSAYATAAQGLLADSALQPGDNISELVNDSGFITSAALTGYLLSSTAASTYVALAGSYANPSWIISLAWSKITGTPTTLSGYGITDAQPLDADLTAIAALTGTGFAVRTASNTWAQRSLTAPAAGLTITNPAGIAGNPTFALANDLAALEALASTGYAVRTATDTWVQRTFTTGSGLSVANGNGVSGNTSYALAAILARSVLANATNASAVPTALQLGAGQAAVGNVSGTGLEAATVLQSVTNSDGFLQASGGNINVNRLIQNQFTQIDDSPPVYANGTGETSIMGGRISGDLTTYVENFMDPGSSFRLNAWGLYSYNGSGSTLQIKVNLIGSSSGTMPLLSTEVLVPTPTAPEFEYEWHLDANITINESGQLWAQGKIWLDSDDLSGRMFYPMKNLDVVGGIDFLGEDWTWDITADWSVADEFNKIKQTNCILDRHKPVNG